MQFLDAATINRAMNYKALVEALRQAFQARYVTPVRHHHTISLPDQSDATLLLMPAWSDAQANGTSYNGYIGIKMVTVFPDNEARVSLPSILGAYFLLDQQSGTVRAIMDGPSLTVWRTACASALAADYLARKDAKTLTMVGTGALSEHLIRAHMSVRDIRRIIIWGRNKGKAERVAAGLDGLDVTVEVADDRAKAVAEGDIISCATMATQPLIDGAWLKPGAHLDLVGAFRPDMRESDNRCITRAEVYLDTIAGATKEGGDIVQPLQTGILEPDDIRGDLFGLTQGKCKGRVRDEDITLFKSVGTAIEDLAAARYIYEQMT
ncbi:ornithine cyclodeaminase family protein [Cohaesibacter sp. CAU 1516]|uniref:ornithine cyclodeaminase family protein n=1 Tax=Cohaesibacter sp. CAU 1516 TaxID=2576038 RepID=UPI0010FCF995|nr:ornithine cyclodeaminase family protein [Cohaesibacter sp. CAU 1516]TLP46060.1 ornithine cyclodeaminase family protein [Cohaesibacter sp. CAU 1516]